MIQRKICVFSLLTRNNFQQKCKNGLIYWKVFKKNLTGSGKWFFLARVERYAKVWNLGRKCDGLHYIFWFSENFQLRNCFAIFPVSSISMVNWQNWAYGLNLYPKNNRKLKYFAKIHRIGASSLTELCEKFSAEIMDKTFLDCCQIKSGRWTVCGNSARRQAVEGNHSADVTKSAEKIRMLINK